MYMYMQFVLCVCRVIDLRYAKVTPGLISSNKASNAFQIRYANPL